MTPRLGRSGGSQGRIPWTPALAAYFTGHFRMLGLASGSGARDVPEAGLYVSP